MAFQTLSNEGINLTTTYTISTSSPELPGPPFKLGMRCFGTDGGEWLFVKVATSKTCVAGDFVVVTSHSAWTIDQLTSTTGKGALGSRVGVAMATATAGVYLWIQVSGYVATANCATSSLAFVALHTTATVGRIDDTAGGGTSATVAGVVQLATSAANVAACILNNCAVGVDD
tara:strand:+ start:227 stop:745 length:519 start_codon:yes stop_codon:yes gene_type:complete